MHSSSRGRSSSPSRGPVPDMALTNPDKGTSAARRTRKARGLPETAQLPKESHGHQSVSSSMGAKQATHPALHDLSSDADHRRRSDSPAICPNPPRKPPHKPASATGHHRCKRRRPGTGISRQGSEDMPDPPSQALRLDAARCSAHRSPSHDQRASPLQACARQQARDLRQQAQDLLCIGTDLKPKESRTQSPG